MGNSRVTLGLLVALLVVAGAYVFLRRQAEQPLGDVAAPPPGFEVGSELGGEPPPRPGGAPDAGASTQRTAPPRPSAAPGAATPPVPLDKLLQVPSSVTAPDPDAIMRRALAAPIGQTPEEKAKSASRVGADVAARSDETVLGRDLSRQQVDADAALALGKGTRLKAGVRLEREQRGSDSGPVDTMPRVGIEKRW